MDPHDQQEAVPPPEDMTESAVWLVSGIDVPDVASVQKLERRERTSSYR